MVSELELKDIICKVLKEMSATSSSNENSITETKKLKV